MPSARASTSWTLKRNECATLNALPLRKLDGPANGIRLCSKVELIDGILGHRLGLKQDISEEKPLLDRVRHLQHRSER